MVHEEHEITDTQKVFIDYIKSLFDPIGSLRPSGGGDHGGNPYSPYGIYIFELAGSRTSGNVYLHVDRVVLSVWGDDGTGLGIGDNERIMIEFADPDSFNRLKTYINTVNLKYS